MFLYRLLKVSKSNIFNISLHCVPYKMLSKVVAAWGFLLVQVWAYETLMLPIWPRQSHLFHKTSISWHFSDWNEQAVGQSCKNWSMDVFFRCHHEQSFTPPDCRRWQSILSETCREPSGSARKLEKQQKLCSYCQRWQRAEGRKKVWSAMSSVLIGQGTKAQREV